MSLISHEFDESGHLYRVPNHFVWSTSDVISMNGLSDVSQVPLGNLEFAGHRGNAVHEAIRAYETGVEVEDVVREYEVKTCSSIMDTVLERMNGYYRFRDKHELTLCGEDDHMEVTRVYQHEGTEILIGTKIDLPCYVDGKFTILDAKTSFRNSGQKAAQDMLKWRLQLQSYSEAMEADDFFWEKYERPVDIGKAILHLHPQCGVVRGQERTGFEYHQIPIDDCHLWDAAIRVAQAKLSAGYQVPRR